MAAPRSDRVYHQDYIARIRYSNTLPPPPNPPKLLDIPDASLSSGLYTSPAFAARLLRDQPLNIEADAELGMPLNLIGLPGVFDGDESIIYGLEHPPPPHPADKALLRPLSMLGKGAQTSGVSFLRRTEYISADASQRIDPSKSRLKQDVRKRKRAEFEKEDPRRMIDDIVKGFNIAYPQDKAPDLGSQITTEEQRAWDNPRHPNDPNLKLLDAYPLLPDLDALGDTGQYLLSKFATNPTTATDAYDARLDVALLRPHDADPEILEQHEAAMAAYNADPTLPVPPQPEYDFDFYLPDDPEAVGAIKTQFDINNSAADVSKDDKLSFRYSYVRSYETYRQSGDPSDAYNDTVALSLHDGGADTRLQKGAYFYPIATKTWIRPKKGRTMDSAGQVLRKEKERPAVDVIEMMVREADEGEVETRDRQKRTMEGLEVDGVGEADAEGEVDAEALVTNGLGKHSAAMPAADGAV